MDRAQAHTLEGFTAALLLVASVTFALEATAVTPLSASTSNQHIENQQRAMAEDLLIATDANGTLREAVLYWNATDGGFIDTSITGYYTNGGPPNDFGQALNQTFDQKRIAFNVYVRHYDNVTGTYRKQTMVYMGVPSDNAVMATHSITVYNDTKLTDPDHDITVAEAATNDTYTFYMSDTKKGSELFNILEVRIVVWRM